MNERFARGRKAWTALACVMAACALLGASPRTAWSQRLDFDGAGVFKAGTEKSVENLAAALREEARERAAKPDGSGASGVGAAQVRVRELAASLLEAGSSYAEDGSVHVLLGRRLAARRAELDEALANVARTDAGAAALVAFLEACPAEPMLVPRGVEDLDRLIAGLFAPLSRGGSPVWAVERSEESKSSAAAYGAALELARAAPGVTPEGVAALQGAALGAPERQIVVQACEAITTPVRWITKEASATLGTMFDDAAKRVESADTRRGALADLVRLALVGDVLKRIDKARFTARQARTMRALAESLAKDVAPGAVECDDTISALRKGLVLLGAYEDVRWADSRRVVREVRPLWREMEAQARRSREELVEALARLTPTTPALSDPGVLSGLASMTRAIGDARALCVISEWLVGAPDPATAGAGVFGRSAPKNGERRADPVVMREDRTRRQAGVRLLGLPAKLRKPETHDEAMSAVRELASGLAVWWPLPGEAAGAGGGGWRQLVGGAGDEVMKEFEASRDAWIAAWAGLKENRDAAAVDEAGGPAVLANRLDLRREVVEIASNVSAVMALSRADGITGVRAWPGFELSAGERGAFEMITAPLRAELPRVAGLAVGGVAVEGGAGDDAELERALVPMRGHAKIVATLAALDRAARARGVKRAPILQELAEPMPAFPTLGETLTPGVWLGEARDSVAAVCRGLEEYAEATRAGERERWVALTRFMVAECDRIQRALGMR